MNYRVVYANGDRREWLPGNFSLQQAEVVRRRLARQGRTAWIVDDVGTFVPVAGAKKEPRGYRP